MGIMAFTITFILPRMGEFEVFLTDISTNVVPVLPSYLRLDCCNWILVVTSVSAWERAGKVSRIVRKNIPNPPINVEMLENLCYLKIIHLHMFYVFIIQFTNLKIKFLFLKIVIIGCNQVVI